MTETAFSAPAIFSESLFDYVSLLHSFTFCIWLLYRMNKCIDYRFYMKE